MGKKEPIEVSDSEYMTFLEERPIREEDDEQEWSIWYDRLVEEDPSVCDQRTILTVIFLYARFFSPIIEERG